jgi:hypothetical protein
MVEWILLMVQGAPADAIFGPASAIESGNPVSVSESRLENYYPTSLTFSADRIVW